MFAHAAVFLWMRTLGEADATAFALRPRHVTPASLLTAQFTLLSPGQLAATVVWIVLFGRFIEQRLGCVRLIALYLGFGPLAFAIGVWTNTECGVLVGTLGVVLVAAFASVLSLSWGQPPTSTSA